LELSDKQDRKLKWRLNVFRQCSLNR